MTQSDEHNQTHAETEATKATTWHLNALTEALGDLTLTVSDSLSVGRGSDNDVVLGSKQVSRNHALLSILNNQLYVKDLDSSNGTFINDERIEGNKSKLLKADDSVGFASFAFQVGAPITAADTANNNAHVGNDTSASEPVITPTVPEPETTPEEEVEEVEEEVAAESVLPIEQTTETDIQNNAQNDVASLIDEPDVAVEPEPVVSTPVETVVVEDKDLDSSIVDSVMAEDPATQRQPEEPVVEEPVIEEVLTTTTEPVTDHPLMKELTASQEPAMQPQPTVTPEHDKTTKTELQEEADPDVLRAKQAATSQLSGTANLGQSRDIGTEGNNAMDQAINNPANAGYVEKKPSGGWFIWVFVAIVIIGLALWLFNMGSV